MMDAMVNRAENRLLRHVGIRDRAGSLQRHFVGESVRAGLAVWATLTLVVGSFVPTGWAETPARATSTGEIAKAPSMASLALETLQLADLSGAQVRPVKEDGRKATVFYFVMHECPVANAYAPEIRRLEAEYGARGVRSHVVYVEDDLPVAKAREHAREYGFSSGALLDPGHRLVKAVGATVSPEAAVLSSAGKLLYLGRIDDRMADFGKRRVEPTQRDLRLALDAILAGTKTGLTRTRAVGCYIPDLTRPKP